MGKGGQQTPATLPPPPQPVIQYDPATSAAEAALASARKQSFASTTETEDEKNKRAQLGAAPQTNVTGQPKPAPRRRRDPASMMPASGIGSSAVLTG